MYTCVIFRTGRGAQFAGTAVVDEDLWSSRHVTIGGCGRGAVLLFSWSPAVGMTKNHKLETAPEEKWDCLNGIGHAEYQSVKPFV